MLRLMLLLMAGTTPATQTDAAIAQVLVGAVGLPLLPNIGQALEQPDEEQGADDRYHYLEQGV